MNKLAVIQMNTSDNVDEILKKAAKYIKRAANEGAAVVALPEMFATIGMPPQDALLLAENAHDENATLQSFLKNQASENNVWLIGGTIPLKAKHSSKSYAACLVYNNVGQLVIRYDKMHLFDVQISNDEGYRESDNFLHGDKIVHFNSPIGTIGLVVCYDLRFPELTRQLYLAGVDVIVVPAAFTVKTGAAHWDVLTRCRAIENQCYLAAACEGGTHPNGRVTYGHSRIVDPWGTVIKQIESGEGMILSTIDHDLINDVRKKMPTRSHVRLNV